MVDSIEKIFFFWTDCFSLRPDFLIFQLCCFWLLFFAYFFLLSHCFQNQNVPKSLKIFFVIHLGRISKKIKFAFLFCFFVYWTLFVSIFDVMLYPSPDWRSFEKIFTSHLEVKMVWNFRWLANAKTDAEVLSRVFSQFVLPQNTSASLSCTTTCAQPLPSMIVGNCDWELQEGKVLVMDRVKKTLHPWFCEAPPRNGPRTDFKVDGEKGLLLLAQNEETQMQHGCAWECLIWTPNMTILHFSLFSVRKWTPVKTEHLSAQVHLPGVKNRVMQGLDGWLLCWWLLPNPAGKCVFEATANPPEIFLSCIFVYPSVWSVFKVGLPTGI